MAESTQAPAGAGPELPDGTIVRLGRGVRTFAGGSVLVGGAPTRVLRLTSLAASCIADGQLRVDGRSRALAAHLVGTGVASPVAETLPPVSLDDLSVVIPAYGRSVALDRLLASIHAELPGVDVVVVDDATEPPEDGRVAAVATRHGARLVRAARNGGPARSRNLGLAQTSCSFVLFVDTDVVLAPGAMQLLARHLAVDPRLAAVAPRVAGLPAARPTPVQRYEAARSSLDLGGRGGLVRPHSELAWVSSSCLLLRVESASAGFDGSLRVAEDVDLVWRLVADGWRVRYEPDAVVWHEHRSTLAAMLRRKALYGSGAAGLAQRHGALAAPLVVPPWGAALLLVLLIGRRPATVVVGVLVVACVAAATLARRVRSMPDRARIVAWLLGAGMVTWAAQGAALLVRHAWPLALVLSLGSSRVRRALVVSAVLDAVVEHVRLRPSQSLLVFGTIRRLDDLAYGLGVWAGALRAGSIGSLLPRISRGRHSGG